VARGIDSVDTLADVNDLAPPPSVIGAGRAWTGSLFVMFALAPVAAVTLCVLEPHPVTFALLVFVFSLVAVTIWRGWGRVCDRMTLADSGIVLRTLWPQREVPLELGQVSRIWLSPNSGTVRIFTDSTSYVLRVRGDLIDLEFEDRLVARLSPGVVSRHYNLTLW